MKEKKRKKYLKRRRRKAVKQWRHLRRRKQKSIRRNRPGKKWKSRYQSVLLSVLVLVLCTGAADQADFEKRWRAFGGWNQEWFEKWGWLGEGMICIQPINRTGREKGEASERVEEGVSLFLREGRLVFFRIRQKPSKEETFQ
ncbi:MAG: hypothetical protein KH110_01300 [Clostridiales bacterium]|uniref:hypothetical protein n=1 Tax=Enterocloster TaxID=2719313 RepID=UPI0015930C50|nr:hypothetical protein [Enterocloster alcoholdehydrogenati]MBS7138936.1 hypothetical protein [Clostridiales bacterium]